MKAKVAPESVREVLAQVRDSWPYPLAAAAVNLGTMLDPLNRERPGGAQQVLKGAVDFVEVWTKFTVVLLLGEVRQAGISVPDLPRKAGEILLCKKGRKSPRLNYCLGDWFAIAAGLATLLVSYRKSCVFAESLNLVLDARGRISSQFRGLRETIPRIRNKWVGHAYTVDGTSPEVIEAIEEALSSIAVIVARSSFLENYAVVLTLYRSGDRLFTWTVRGIHVTEQLASAGSTPDPVCVSGGSRTLGISPFAFFSTIPADLDYYYMFESLVLKTNALQDVSYLGIGPLRTRHRLLSTFNDCEGLARQFAGLFLYLDPVPGPPSRGGWDPSTELEPRTENTIDRSTVRERLAASLDHAGTILVEAPPGAGKSVLAAWMGLKDSAFVVFQRWEQDADALRRLYRDLAMQVTWALGDPIAELPDDEARLRELVLLLFARIAGRSLRPLLLVYDGFDELRPVHHAALFEFLQSLPANVRALVFTRPCKDGIPESVVRVHLPPFSRAELAQVPEIKELRLSAAQLEALVRLSEGNPLIATIMARQASQGQDAIPHTLREYHLGLLAAFEQDGQGAEARKILALLCAASRPMRYEELHRLVLGGETQPNLAAVSSLFRRLRQYLTSDLHGGCRFYHKSLGEVVKEWLPAEAIHDAHNILARYFSESCEDDLRFVPFHLYEAGDRSRMLRFAADHPKPVVDFLVSRARPGRDWQVPEFVESMAREVFWSLHGADEPSLAMVAAQVCYYLGFWNEARRMYSGIDVNRERLAPERRIELSVTLGALYKNVDEWQKARTVLEEAIRSLTGFAPYEANAFRLEPFRKSYAALGRMYHNLASILYDQGTSRATALRLFELSRVLASRCADEVCELAAENGRLCGFIEGGKYVEARCLIGDLCPRFQRWPVEESYFRLNRLALHLVENDLDAAAAILGASASSASELEHLLASIGNRQMAAYFSNNAAVFYHLRGDGETAQRFLSSSIKTCEGIGDRCMCAGALINLGVFTCDRMAFESAEQIARDIGDEEEIVYILHNMGALGLRDTDWTEVKRLYSELGDEEGLRRLSGPRPWVMTQFVDLFL